MLDLTPSFRLFAAYRARRLDTLSAVEAQKAVLAGLIKTARNTRFGRDHGFSTIRDVEDFQRQVPLRAYQEFWEEYWKEGFPRIRDCTWPGSIPYFALTSGTTTGVTKYIPYTKEMSKTHFAGMLQLLIRHVINRPKSRILGGQGLMLGGTSDLTEEAPGVYAGDLSGIAANSVPLWLRSRIVPRREISLIADWDEKLERLAPLSLTHDIRALGGAPNWLLLFFDRLAELTPEAPHRLSSYYPNLELIVHGGVNFAPYRKRFRELLEGSNAETREVYSASEAFIAVADRGDGEGLRLVTHKGVFFEFVPAEELASPAPTRHWLANIELDVEYALTVSTCGGTWAYKLGDTVRFVERDPPRLLVTGRTTYVLSAFGEHLIDEEIEDAVSLAAESIEAAVTDYAVAPIFPEQAEASGRHHYVVEFSGVPGDPRCLETFTLRLDERLRHLNADYRTHRRNDLGLKSPRVQFVRPGSFADWMKRRKQLGGQHKIPRIINDAVLFEDLKAFTASRIVFDFRAR